ncbi:unnamed protein product [Sphagnum jensenii]|uniref:Uncharacterized protein n=1 Tax=Sphagnum jensenii TaxID=128206 RepID=A0ABP1BWJ9_9BRYO
MNTANRAQGDGTFDNIVHYDIFVLVQNELRKHGFGAERSLEHDVAGWGGRRGVVAGDAVRALHVGFPTRCIGRFGVPLATHHALALSAMLGGVAILLILDIFP